MVFAAWQQRECALGRGKQVLPFGTPVHVRSKVFGAGGKYDLEMRWSAGYFVGPSSDVKDGLGANERWQVPHEYTHLRPYLIDADEKFELDPLTLDLPVPTRRVTGKKTLALLEKLESEAQRRRTLEATAEAMSKRFLETGSYETERLLELYGAGEVGPVEHETRYIFYYDLLVCWHVCAGWHGRDLDRLSKDTLDCKVPCPVWEKEGGSGAVHGRGHYEERLDWDLLQGCSEPRRSSREEGFGWKMTALQMQQEFGRKWPLPSGGREPFTPCTRSRRSPIILVCGTKFNLGMATVW